MQVIILGDECPDCDELEEHVRLALDRLGIKDAEIERVWDIRQEMEEFGIEKVPALIIDGTLVLRGGHVPPVETLVRMIEDREWEA